MSVNYLSEVIKSDWGQKWSASRRQREAASSNPLLFSEAASSLKPDPAGACSPPHRQRRLLVWGICPAPYELHFPPSLWQELPLLHSLSPAVPPASEQVNTCSRQEQPEISSASRCLPWAPCTGVTATSRPTLAQQQSKLMSFFSKTSPPSSPPYQRQGTEMGNGEETSFGKNYHVSA